MADTTSLKQRITELEQVHRLAESLASIHRVHEMLEAITGCCVKLCSAERASVVLLGPDQDDVAKTVVRAATSQAEEIDHRINQSLAGWMMFNRRALLAKDICTELNIRGPDGLKTNHGSVLALPLEISGQLFGFINLMNSKTGKVFSEDDLRIVSIIAPLAAQSIHRAKMFAALWDDHVRLQEKLMSRRLVRGLTGDSKLMREVRERVSLVAAKSTTVLLVGETGTGKELAAQAIHCESPRASNAFVAINCSAIPDTLVESELFGHERGAFTGATEMRKGKFEAAHGGTLFLDEISTMPLPLQSKLLRVLEQRKICRVGSSGEIEVDVRVIAATNKDLRKAVNDGEFREDLFQRLNVVPISLPPLRDRSEDIPLLAEGFLQEFAGSGRRFATETLQILKKMEWKGNVRELRNAVERISVLTSSEEIVPDDLRVLDPHGEGEGEGEFALLCQRLLRLHDGKKDLLDATEQHLVALALRAASGNTSQAARLLGVDRNVMLRRVEKYGLKSSPQNPS